MCIFLRRLPFPQRLFSNNFRSLFVIGSRAVLFTSYLVLTWSRHAERLFGLVAMPRTRQTRAVRAVTCGVVTAGDVPGVSADGRRARAERWKFSRSPSPATRDARPPMTSSPILAARSQYPLDLPCSGPGPAFIAEWGRRPSGQPAERLNEVWRVYRGGLDSQASGRLR
jgi:hypothetical protein